MSARKSLPIGIIVMIMMMALASLGVGYAWWTEQLTAAGTVQTGSIDVKMENVSVSEVDPLEVATCNYNVSEDGKSMTITINSAYPTYNCVIDFSLTNYGSVPAKITNVNVPILNGEFLIVPTVSDTTLAPSTPVNAEFAISIRRVAKQNTKYTFDLSFDIAQGNAP